jgi:DNA-binding transcriptional regulator YhcF (GntR family)
MQEENFESIEELKNAEDNQVFSKVDKEISEKDFPQYSEFPVEPTPDGLSYKAPKPTVERKEPTIAERLAQGPKYKDRSKLEAAIFGPDIELQGDFGIPAQRVVERLYRKATGKEVEPVDNFSTTESMVAGLIDGNVKLVKFPVNIASEVIDFARGSGVSPDKSAVAKVEKYFNDSIIGKIGTEAEDIAFQDAAGKLTSAAVQIFGLAKPTQMLTDWGFKTANRYFQAAKLNQVATGSKNLERATKEALRLNQLSGKQKFASFMIGGGLGMAAVADPEEFGTLSELLKGTRFEGTLGVLGLDRERKQDPRDEAARRLWNRTKLGIEQGLITWPILFVGGKIGNIVSKQSKDVYASNDDLNRWIEKYLVTPFRSRGVKSEELFEEMQRVKGKISAGQVQGIDLIKDIDAALLKISKEAGISKGTPELKRLIGRMDELLVTGNDVIKGKEFLFKGFDPKKLSEFKKFASTEVGLASDQIERLIAQLANARNAFNNYKNTFFGGGNINVAANEFAKIMSERMQNVWTSEYRIFEDNFKLFPWLNYKPIQSNLDEAKQVLGRYAAQNGVRLTDEQLDDQLKTILKEVRRDPLTGAPEFPLYNQSVLAEDGIQYINMAKSFEGGRFKPSEFFKKEEDVRKFQRLFGQKRDLRNTIISTMSDLSTLTAKDTFYNNILKLNDDLIKQKRPGVFYDSPTAARSGLRNTIGGEDIITTKGGLNIKSPIGEEVYTNPLNGKYTSKPYADALNFSEKILFDELARNTWYQHLVLIPKGLTQISKTVLGPFTHTRNFITQGQFVLANGNLFKDPRKIVDNFKRAFNTIQPQLIYRNLPKDQAMARFLMEEGIMSSSAIATDISGLMDDMSKTGDVYSRLFGKFGNKMKDIYKFAFDLYVAEDDIWKVYSTFSEFDNYKNLYTNAVKSGKLKNMPSDLQIMKQATKIVRDTLPNYGYVGDFVKSMRRTPLGNFMSWPASVIRSGLKTFELAQKEIRDPVLHSQGVKRMMTFGTVTAAALPAIQSMVHGAFGITNKMVAASRFFVPDFSRNSTLILTQDADGNFKYIDGSGSFVYDTLTSPFQSIIAEINISTGYDPKAPIIPATYKGLIRGIGKLMEPFISESIWLETFNNLVIRKGVTPDGRRLWNPEMDNPDKVIEALKYFIEQTAPGSYKQSVRLKKAITGEPGERGEKYEIDDEVAGFYGLRQIKLEPLKKMDFKLNEYQKAVADARKIFTVPAQKGGVEYGDDFIEKFYYANRKKYEAMSNLKITNEMAETLNVNKNQLAKVYNDRNLLKDYKYLESDKFKPYSISKPLRQKTEEIYKELSTEFDNIEIPRTLSNETLNSLSRMINEMSRVPLGENLGNYINIDDYLNGDRPSLLGPRSEGPVNVQPLPLQPQPNPQVVSKPQVAPGLQTGLTATETGLLTDAEKAIRLRQQGLA